MHIGYNECHVLIARRTTHRYMLYKLEFTCGKVKEGETPEHALAKELMEELGLHTKIGEHFHTTTHSCLSFDICLICYHCGYLSGEFLLTDHDRVEWGDLQWKSRRS